MTQAKTFYFLFYGALASISPFLPLFYLDLGFSGAQIGMLAGIPPLVGLVSSPLWSGVADATQRHGLILYCGILGTMACVSGLLFESSYGRLIPIVSLYALFLAPVTPLVDNAVLARLGRRRDEYGKQRLWGTIGWGIGGAAVGLVVESMGLRWAFGACLLMLSGVLAVSRGLASGPTRGRAPYWPAFRELMRNRLWLSLLVTVFLLGVCSAGVRIFLFIHVKNLGGGERLIGLSLPVAVVGELPVFFFADRALRRWGARGLLLFSVACFALQAFLFSVMWAPWLLLPLTILHGPSWSAQLTARITYAREIAPDHLGATAQGLIASASSGLAAAVGAVAGGTLYDAAGAPFVFRAAAIGAVGCLLFFAVTSRPRATSSN